MNDFADLLARQVRADLAALPDRTRGRLNAAGLAARAGTIGELRAAARRRVPGVVFDYVDGGAGDEVTLRRNVAALRAIELRPRVLVDVSAVETATTVLGHPVALPLIGAPMGLTGLLHPQAEVALARALHAAGTVSVLAAMASCPVEEVTAASPGPVWFQMYLWRDRGLLAELLDRVRAAGVGVLMVTVDVPCSGNRDRDRRNGFSVPPRVTLRALADGVVRPRWSAGFLRQPRIGWGNLPGGGTGASDGTTLSARTNQQFDPAATWADLEWFREHWDGPLVVKGILNPQDARQAARLGAGAVVVSNHGGRQLDGAPATISALPAVADAVAGEAGVRRAADILHAELRTVLALAGCPSVHDLDASWVTRPPTLPGDRLEDRR